MPHRRRPLRSPILALAFLAAGCASDGTSNEVVRLIRSERYADAVDLSAKRAKRSPNDAAAQRLHRDASVAYLLDQGRTALFEHRLEDALEAFNEALSLSPENPSTPQWLRRAREELTNRWLDAGRDFLLADRFDEALDAYELALYYHPGNTEALFGAARVLFLINYRAGLGEEYYNQGVRAVHAHLLREARAKFAYSSKYAPGGRAEARRDQVESELAQERLFRARGLEEDGLYGAALVEYRIVLLFEPDNARARAGFDAMQREVEARRALAEVEKLVRQRRFEDALATLAQGQELTQLQQDRFSRIEGEIELARLEALYQRGRDEERDFRYEVAIATYAELLDRAGPYADAEDRKRTLEDYVERATELYSSLDEAAGPAEQLELLREIELVWPEYLDVQVRIRALEAELSSAPEADGAG